MDGSVDDLLRRGEPSEWNQGQQRLLDRVAGCAARRRDAATERVRALEHESGPVLHTMVAARREGAEPGGVAAVTSDRLIRI
jgi:hypothetical protein